MKRLYRSRTDRMLFGVAGGLAKYFEVDVVLVRLLWVLAVIAFGLVGYEAYRRSGSWRIAGVVTELACLMAANNLIVRTQNWAWIPFIIFLILFSAYADGRLRGGWLLLCPLVMAFWVNVHGSFILGIVLAAIYFAGEATRAFLKLERHLTWRQVGWLGLAGGLTLAALLANPTGVGIVGYVQKMMTDRSSQKLIVEWQSPDPANLASLVFFISILCLMAAWAYHKKRRPTPTEMLTVAAFLMLAWSGVRYVVWYGMAVMPVLASWSSDFFQGRSWAVPPPRNRVNLILAALLVLLLIPFQPWWIEKMPLPEKVWDQVWRGSPVGPMLTTGTPLGAAEYLRQHPGGKLFNEMGYGSYLIWALPEQKVFVDPRVELYPYELWLDYIRISNGTRYNRLLDRYGADRLVLDLKEQEDLIRSLEDDPGWIREYADPYAQIWRKRN